MGTGRVYFAQIERTKSAMSVNLAYVAHVLS